MTSAFSWQNSVKLCQHLSCFILYSEAKFACYSRYLLLSTFAFQSLMMKRTSFFGANSRKSCRSLQNQSTSASLASVVGAQTWITVMFSGFPWKETDIILFLRLHPSTAFWTLVDYEGYFISSKRFLPTVLDIMVI